MRTVAQDGRVEVRTGEEFTPSVTRMVVAVLSLIGIFVSGYLALYKFGFLGALQCGAAGGCEVVQASEYAVFLGLPVALWGMGAYVLLLALALAGLQPRWAGERWLALALFGVAAVGVLVSAVLTYISASVIGAFCQWCLISAVLVTLIFLFSLPGLRYAK